MTTYFISNDGNDTNDGRSELKPWRTLARANQQALTSGDSMRLRRGDTFTGNLFPKSSGRTNLDFLDYGVDTAAKPKIIGSGGRGAVRIQGAIGSSVQNLSALAPDVAGGMAFNFERGNGNVFMTCEGDGGKSNENVRCFSLYMSKGSIIASCKAKDALYLFAAELPKAFTEGGQWPFFIQNCKGSGAKYGKADDHDGIKAVSDLNLPDIDCTGAVIEGNDITDADEDFCDVIHAAGITMQDNTFHGATVNPNANNSQFFKSRGANCIIRNNTCWGISLAKGNGIVAFGMNAVVEGNRIANVGTVLGDAMNSGGYGILFADGRGAVIRNNAVVDCRIGIGHLEDVIGGPITTFSGNVAQGRQVDMDIPNNAIQETPNLCSRR